MVARERGVLADLPTPKAGALDQASGVLGEVRRMLDAV